MSEPNVGDVIRTYMKLRDQKAAIEAEVKEKVSGIKAKLEKLEAFLKAQMDSQGLTSFKSDYGTAFLTTTDYANVADWDAVLDFIRDNEAYDMLGKACQQDCSTWLHTTKPNLFLPVSTTAPSWK